MRDRELLIILLFLAAFATAQPEGPFIRLLSPVDGLRIPVETSEATTLLKLSFNIGNFGQPHQLDGQFCVWMQFQDAFESSSKKSPFCFRSVNDNLEAKGVKVFVRQPFHFLTVSRWDVMRSEPT